jgi:hypothetical protein
MATPVQQFMDVDFPARLAQHPDQARAIGGKIQLNIKGDRGGEWFINASRSGPLVKPGRGVVDLYVAISVEDFEKLLEDPEANCKQLFSEGKLKPTGDANLILKLGTLFSIGHSKEERDRPIPQVVLAR